MSRFWIIFGLTILAASPASAHPGDHVFSFQSGLLHPLGGLDHLLAILACGLYAARADGRARWALPVGFLGAMTLGALWGHGSDGRPVEILVGLSVIVSGLALLARWRPHVIFAGLIAAGVGLAHGYVHGAEAPATSSALLYGTGFLTSTAGLLALGVVLGRAGRRGDGLVAIRIAGGLMAAVGMAIVAA